MVEQGTQAKRLLNPDWKYLISPVGFINIIIIGCLITSLVTYGLYNVDHKANCYYYLVLTSFALFLVLTANKMMFYRFNLYVEIPMGPWYLMIILTMKAATVAVLLAGALLSFDIHFLKKSNLTYSNLEAARGLSFVTLALLIIQSLLIFLKLRAHVNKQSRQNPTL